MALGIEGRAVLSCDVTATGALSSCSVPEEAPKGLGFRAAALRMSGSFQMRPGIGMSGRTPHGDVRIPINFRLPALPPAPPTPTLPAETKALAARLAKGIDPAPGFLAHYEREAKKLAAGRFGVPREVGAEAGEALLMAARAKTVDLQQALGAAIAARLSPAELAEFVTFAESDVGRRWLAGNSGQSAELKRLGQNDQERFRTEAHRLLCQSRDCSSAAEPAPMSPQTASSDPILSGAPWSQRPTLTDTLAAWPVSFLFGIAGWSRLDCTVGLQGAPEECELVYESPRGLGVEAAARGLAERYRISAQSLPDYVGKRVAIREHFFALDDAETEPVAAAANPSARLMLARRILEFQAQRAKPSRDAANRSSLATILKPLDPALRQEMETALLMASDANIETMISARAAFVAERYDEVDLQKILRFEESVGPAIERVRAAGEEDAQARVAHIAEEVSAAARDAFCKSRDCTAPTFNQPRPESPPASTLNP
ncbi:MAG: hypothetical protein A2790_07755 [Phenylobacterium sp. RIFCSPHIGHO2_01_FULL_69_31]|nr:MAG: hypothetical protein A2790_07755 [Phenylobacterium sp. RIFCSPHIGHO2_01_FULL_69_31]